MEAIFGPAKLAIQILIILMLLGTIARVFYTLNVKLPKLPKINVEREPAPAPEKKPAKAPYITRESQTSSDSDLLKKLEQGTGKKPATV